MVSPASGEAHAAVRRVVQRGRVRAEPEQQLHRIKEPHLRVVVVPERGHTV